MAEVYSWFDLLFRWTHVVAGVLWIGHLYFFNFVNAALAKSYDADTKRKVIPELMPRALYWFRYGALWTWLSGFCLLGFVYHANRLLVTPESGTSMGLAAGVSLLSLILGFVIYQGIWQSPLGKNEKAATAVSFLAVVATSYGLTHFFSGRAAFIHLGAIFGTIMAANVWMKIWPAQRKIITAVKNGEAPDPALAAAAGLRSKHNTYLSVPLLMTMVSNHFATVIGHDLNWLILSAAVLVGWGVVKALYAKSATPAVTAI